MKKFIPKEVFKIDPVFEKYVEEYLKKGFDHMDAARFAMWKMKLEQERTEEALARADASRPSSGACKPKR